MIKQEADEKDQSEFNAGITHLMIISDIKRNLANATVYEDHKTQYRLLVAFYKCLISIMDEEDDKIQTENFEKNKRNYYILCNLEKTKKTNKKTIIPKEIIDGFDDWEISLRNMEQKYGLCLPKRKDARFALAGGRT